MAMSSLVQRQSERQGIFLIALSPLERGAGGVKYLPFFLPLPLRGRRKENNPVNCFLTTGAELLICAPATATEANVTVTADRSKLVLLSPQHLCSQTVDTTCRVRVTTNFPYILP